jgi:2-hydroxychromene-2-carboxylate isomerase
MARPRATADFWFDPLCPWAWMTSRWLKEVERVREVTPSFHVMSLGYLNADPDIPDDEQERPVERWGPVRVCLAAAHAHGDGVLDRLYTELGTRFHNQGNSRNKETIEHALTAAGLPKNLADAMESRDYDDAVIASHRHAMDLVGLDVGTPVISVQGVAFFGPVVTPIPRGEAAGKLWDGVLLVASTDGFYELKRSRTADPSFD